MAKKDSKLHHTIQQIQHPKKLKFIDYYRETRGHISNCARAIGIDRSTYYKWLESDEDFAMAIAEAESELNDDMREALVQLGAEGNLGAIIFYLKNRHPDFKQNKATGVRIDGPDIKVEFIEYES